MRSRAATSLAASLLMACLAAAHASSQTPSPLDDRTEWRVGFSSFAGEGIAEADRHLLTSIPLLLIEQLAAVEVHRLTDAERSARAESVLRAARRAQSQRVAGLQRALGDAQLRAAPRSTVERELEEAVAQLQALRDLPPESVAVAPTKPVAIASASAESPLFAPASFSVPRFASQSGLDLLVTGTIEEIEGFLFIEAAAFDPAAGVDVFQFNAAEAREGVAAATERLGAELATVLLGSPWATVAIDPLPATATVSVDGVFLGVGRTVVPFLPAGDHVVAVTAAGHAARRIDLAIDGGESLELTPALVAVEPALVAVSSEPPQAAVYLDSVWMGVTPLSVPLPETGLRLEMRRDGYFSRSVDLAMPAAPELRIALDRDTGDRQAQQEMARDHFYRSLGWFVMTSAPPLLLGMAAADATARVKTLVAAGADASAALEQRTWFIRGLLTSAIAAGITFGVSMEALGDYLAAANRAAS